MKAAIISDVHGNKGALDLIVADAGSRGADEFWCLGDMVGYGPYPLECLRWAEEHCRFFIQGNHESSVVAKIENELNHHGLNLSMLMKGPGAVEGALWAIRQMYADSEPVQSDKHEANKYTGELLRGVYDKKTMVRRVADFVTLRTDRTALGKRLFEYMRDAPTSVRADTPLGKVLLTHDNPLSPGDWRYTLDVHDPFSEGSGITVDKVFAEWDSVIGNDVNFVFLGHLHIAGVYVSRSKNRYVCNPGSCMPRRGPKKISYALFDSDDFMFPIRTFVFDYDFDGLARSMRPRGLRARFMEEDYGH